MPDDLAERAARKMGWQYVMAAHAHVAAYWIDGSGRRVGPPSLADPAFCWAMLEWLLMRDEALLLGRDGTVSFDRRPYGQHELGSAADWPEALARAVIATQEEKS